MSESSEHDDSDDADDTLGRDDTLGCDNSRMPFPSLQMTSRMRGRELIVYRIRDSLFGPVALFGSVARTGGIIG